jgi:hypothetical protein
MARCATCKYARGETRWKTPTFRADGYAICDKVTFNSDPFWDGNMDNLTKRQEKPVVIAWVVDGSDYWAALHVTPDFGCNQWEPDLD